MSAASAGEAAEAASAAKNDNTTFFIESAPFIRPAQRFPADPLACHLASRAAKLPGCDQSGRVLMCVTGKFRPVACRRGKPKTGATAAFLGELAC
jgi:hypothetical protein